MTIYFYKADDDYGCFSNFSHHPITLGGQHWPTVEHYYQAHKFLGTLDEPLMAVIRQAPSPEAAARLGRDRRRQPRPNWNQIKPQLMYEAVTVKFLSHLDIQQILLNTGEEELIENSPVDYFWGCGADGSGQNHLGRILMTIRSELRQQQPSCHPPHLKTRDP
ncbi:Swarming motility protein ybiA [Phormidium willei BDU 130791]|nr:Swarming motility protein ybiA [Phormidium willei BDU 130791]